MIVYRECHLPNGAVVTPLDCNREGNNPRNRAFVMYYHRLRNGRTIVRFGMVLHLIEDPADDSRWAGILLWNQIRNAVDIDPPRPRQCEGFRTEVRQRGEDEHTWICIKDIIDIIGLATTYKQHGAVRAQPKFWIIDRLGKSEDWDGLYEPCMIGRDQQDSNRSLNLIMLKKQMVYVGQHKLSWCGSHRRSVSLIACSVRAQSGVHGLGVVESIGLHKEVSAA